MGEVNNGRNDGAIRDKEETHQAPGGLATPKRLDVPISAVFTGVAYKNYVLDRYSILSPRIPPLKARESFII